MASADSGPIIDRYTEVKTSVRLPDCPICGSMAELWQYQERRYGRVLRFVGCSNDQNLGHQGKRADQGCLLNRPPDDFYKPTIKSAIDYWQHYYDDLIALRRRNTLKLVEAK